MAIYVGSSDNTAKAPSKIYAGVSGTAKAVNAVYVGDPAGAAKKVWPSAVVMVVTGYGPMTGSTYPTVIFTSNDLGVTWSPIPDTPRSVLNMSYRSLYYIRNAAIPKGVFVRCTGGSNNNSSGSGYSGVDISPSDGQSWHSTYSYQFATRHFAMSAHDTVANVTWPIVLFGVSSGLTTAVSVINPNNSTGGSIGALSSSVTLVCGAKNDTIAVAVGYSGYVAYNTPLLPISNWVVQQLTYFSYAPIWRYVIFANNSFVAVGGSMSSVDTGYAGYSSNGITWTVVALGVNGTNWLYVTYAANYFVACGYTSTAVMVAYSTNGTTWATVTLATGAATPRSTQVLWTGTRFVLVGQTDVSVGYIAYSTNGTTWTSAVLPAATPGLYTIMQAGGVLIVTGANGTILRSTNDGVTWSTVSTSIANNVALVGSATNASAT